MALRYGQCMVGQQKVSCVHTDPIRVPSHILTSRWYFRVSTMGAWLSCVLAFVPETLSHSLGAHLILPNYVLGYVLRFLNATTHPLASTIFLSNGQCSKRLPLC
ncbi:hypothetical protein Csa_003729 [Cucumis sativus]|uniref:Uncharacterized protein n=1 Tax=Cucumis sativus TaxID=3659 RepID=A0A0A0KIY0_CUCSA|nr:hypothetical protein Csa_003729 [Cucumis sativus]